MRSGRIWTLLAILTLAIQATFSSVAHAGGIGVSPAMIDLNDALRGTEYQRTVLLTNAESAEVKFEFSSEGQAGEWATLYAPDTPDVPITSVLAPPNSTVQLLLKLRLPSDAANGLHTGRVLFSTALSAPRDQTGGTLSVSVGIGVDLRISVTGVQKLNGQVMDMGLVDVEVDQPPLRLTTAFQNTGNVKATPRVHLQVKNSEDKLAGEANFSDVTVEPGAIARIVSEWDHSGLPVGKYIAAVEVLLEDSKVSDQVMAFQVLPRGTLTRVGVLRELKLANDPPQGGTAKLVGTFQNTGKIDCKAVLVAEVFRDSNLLRVVESRERMIPAGQIEEIELFVETPEVGKYSVKAKVNYEGKLTQAQEVEFEVLSATGNNPAAQPGGKAVPAGSEQNTGFPFATVASIVAVVVLCGGATAFWLRGRATRAQGHRTG